MDTIKIPRKTKIFYLFSFIRTILRKYKIIRWYFSTTLSIFARKITHKRERESKRERKIERAILSERAKGREIHTSLDLLYE